MSSGYKFSCGNCNIDGEFFILTSFPWREYEYKACPNCQKIYSSDGSSGGFLVSKKYLVLYRNVKNTKWIRYIKEDKEKLELIKKEVCPECKKQLIDLNEKFKKSKKEETIPCFFCKKNKLSVKNISKIH